MKGILNLLSTKIVMGIQWIQFPFISVYSSLQSQQESQSWREFPLVYPFLCPPTIQSRWQASLGVPCHPNAKKGSCQALTAPVVS